MCLFFFLNSNLNHPNYIKEINKLSKWIPQIIATCKHFRLICTSSYCPNIPRAPLLFAFALSYSIHPPPLLITKLLKLGIYQLFTIYRMSRTSTADDAMDQTEKRKNSLTAHYLSAEFVVVVIFKLFVGPPKSHPNPLQVITEGRLVNS